MTQQTWNPELFWLAAVCVMTGLMWVPYIVNRVQELGPPGWGWAPPPDPPPRAAWAARAVRAHLNAVENLAIFAPLALAVQAAHIGNRSTAAACAAYFAARAVHYLVCVIGMPIVPRTVAFLVGVAAQMTLGWTVLAAML